MSVLLVLSPEIALASALSLRLPSPWRVQAVAPDADALAHALGALALSGATDPRPGAEAPEHLLVAAWAESGPVMAPWLAQWGDAAPCAISVFDEPEALHAGLRADGAASSVTGWWPAAWLAQPAAMTAALAHDRTRHQRDAAARTDLARLRLQIDERKWVDRAKGVLMSARGMGEDEAFRLLRGASMHTNLRVGEVSRSVIEAAQWAEAINRAGQLRMLSQRLVKLAAQRLAGADARRARSLLDEAMARAQDNLDRLTTLLPAGAPAPSSAALARAHQAWQSLRTDLQAALVNRRGVALLAAVDQRAEALLAAAETLTDALQLAGARRALHIINLCGRQRMRVQRLAKDALLAALLNEPQRRVAMPEVMDAFEAALRELAAAPLSSEDIRAGLAEAGDEWLRLLRGLRGGDDADSQALLAGASDALLDIFDRLTAAYEHSLQVIMS